MTSMSINVIGGAYGETCAFPRMEVYRGSGGRAAAMLSSLGVSVTFHTQIGPALLPFFEGMAMEFSYSLHAVKRNEDIWFRYRHPLGQPTIHPVTIPTIGQAEEIHADYALVFGMIEGRPTVHANRVVYDPQDGFQAQHFAANGSSANEIALVVSYSEGKALTGEIEPIAMADKLLTDPKVVAVVIKCGPSGALVKTKNDQDWVRAFPTTRVYKIGSGDAFSAAFAFAWLMTGEDAVAAAWFASRVAAAYVETAHDRFDNTAIATFRKDAHDAYQKFGKGHPRGIPDTAIYLAGPFFNTAQQWLVDEVRDILLDMGFRVFSPIHDVGPGPADVVARADLYELEQCGLVLALLDGMDPGTIFEVGYARARNIPVVIIAESADANALTMMLGSGCEIAHDLTTGVYAAIWHVMGDV